MAFGEIALDVLDEVVFLDKNHENKTVFVVLNYYPLFGLRFEDILNIR